MHGIGGCEKKVNAERSQALLGTTRKLQREELAAKETTKAKKLLIIAHLLLQYRANGWAICHFLLELYGRTVLTERPLYV